MIENKSPINTALIRKIIPKKIFLWCLTDETVSIFFKTFFASFSKIARSISVYSGLTNSKALS